MKILVFSPYYPPHTGGLETHSDEFNKYLSQHGVDITVFTPHLPSDTPAKEIRYRNVQIIYFPAFEIISNYPLPKFWLPSFWRLFVALFQESPDIILSRTRFFVSSFIALIYAKITHTKHVHIEHGSDFVKLSSPFKNLLAKAYDYTFGFLVFHYSDLNISISKAVQKFVQAFDRRESPIIYRGMDFDTIDAIPSNIPLRERYPNKILITTAARLYKWKGIENTLEAIHILPKDLKTKIVFLIIGDGEDFHHLKSLSRNLPVEMMGRLSRTETISTLKASDIYVHSSFPGGGLSTSLLEAMLCRCAIIATPNEGADEVIEHDKNGLIIRTPREISDAIIHLSQEKSKREDLSRTAESDIREKFSWNTSIEKYLAIFEAITKK